VRVTSLELVRHYTGYVVVEHAGMIDLLIVYLPWVSSPASQNQTSRKNEDNYEYIAVYVHDLCMAMKNPQEFVDILQNVQKFKTKGTGPICFHLVMDYIRDDDGTLFLSPVKYIEKLIDNYEKLFGEKPKQVVTLPLQKRDNPETDSSDLLDNTGIQIYQSMIGALQWVVKIGRFDISTAVMTMSGFRIAPIKGHLERLKRIYG
jgi:hypothetical protein